MKEIKAFIHRVRAADVIHALKAAGFQHLTVVDVKGMLAALDAKEREYSLELGTETITEIKLELVCEDERLDQALKIIRQQGRTGQPLAGWVSVSEVQALLPIDGEASSED